MIDHISIAVRDLTKGEKFYTAALAPLGFSKLKEWPGAAIGFGKKYPEFWINKREAMGRVAEDSGVHICLRAPDHGIGRCFSCCRAERRRHIRRRARPAAALSRRILRRLRPRSRRQSHRSGDVREGQDRLGVSQRVSRAQRSTKCCAAEPGSLRTPRLESSRICSATLRCACAALRPGNACE